MFYSDWQLGTIQTELTTLTPLITEDSAKQLVNSSQLTVICMIGLLGVMYDYCVSPAHSEIVLIYKELKANSEIMSFCKLRGDCDTMS